MKNNPGFKSVRFDYVLGIPLSPEKKKNGELDRVSEICKILSKEMGVEYLEEGLSLTEHVTRREYKRLGKQTFTHDYYKSLELKTPIPLDNKTILIVDDVITDGVTLRVTAKKIKDSFPNCRIYAATAGIMAKVNNMKQDVVDKFKK
jgi:predicted amidophosphoribosyltransferase